MDYIYFIIKKELKALLFNKKVFVITILAQIIILFYIIKSRDLFEPSGFHSIAFSIDLIISGLICQLLPESYYYDKETGIENLLRLSKKNKKICTIRFLLYSLISVFILLFISFLFYLLFRQTIYNTLYSLIFNIMNCFIITLLELESLIIINEKTVSTYLSFFLVIGYSLLSISVFDILISLISIFAFVPFIIVLILLLFILNITQNLSYRIFGN